MKLPDAVVDKLQDGGSLTLSSANTVNRRSLNRSSLVHRPRILDNPAVTQFIPKSSRPRYSFMVLSRFFVFWGRTILLDQIGDHRAVYFHKWCRARMRV